MVCYGGLAAEDFCGGTNARPPMPWHGGGSTHRTEARADTYARLFAFRAYLRLVVGVGQMPEVSAPPTVKDLTPCHNLWVPCHDLDADTSRR